MVLNLRTACRILHVLLASFLYLGTWKGFEGCLPVLCNVGRCVLHGACMMAILLSGVSTLCVASYTLTMHCTLSCRPSKIPPIQIGQLHL